MGALGEAAPARYLPAMSILWLLLPAPFVGYLVADWGRRAFSDDPRLIRRLVVDQPVTMLAGLTILGMGALWVASLLAARLLAR